MYILVYNVNCTWLFKKSLLSIYKINVEEYFCTVLFINKYIDLLISLLALIVKIFQSESLYICTKLFNLSNTYFLDMLKLKVFTDLYRYYRYVQYSAVNSFLNMEEKYTIIRQDWFRPFFLKKKIKCPKKLSGKLR